MKFINKRFDFGNFEITVREILTSISIIAVMMLFGFLISGKISENQMDQNEIYNKAVKIESQDLFEYGMNTNVGNAFVYGELNAVDTVSYPEIDGEYMYIGKTKERYERHEKEVTKEDEDGNEYTEIEVYYTWDTVDSESLHSNQISFCGVLFPYSRINRPSSHYIDTIYGEREFSWSSGEFVKVRYEYYGTSINHTGTIFTQLRDGSISEGTNFYENMTIEDTIDYLESGFGIVFFWAFWILLIAGIVFGFYYVDNRWLD